jgi:hypothetical protein
MRKYEAIWIQLKATSNCKIVAPPSLHARIKKAITKEKYKDVAYKVQWDLEGTELPTLEITLDIDARGHKIKNILVFRLIKPVLLGEL